jgi:outer membrane protein insertion porin family
MARLPSLFLGSTLILSLQLAASGQQFKPKSIQFKGDPEFSDQELLDAAGLQPGKILTSAEMADHSKRLMDSGVFDNLTYKFDGQDLVYTLTPAEHLYPIRLENLPLDAGPELDAKLHQKLPLYHGKVPSEGTLLDDVRAALAEIVAAQGAQISITATPFGQANSRNIKAMSFSIASPPVHTIVIHIEGVAAADEGKVRALLAESAKIPFDSEHASGNLEQSIGSFYVDKGYAGAKVSAARVGDLRVEPGELIVPYSINIEQGPPYKLGTVHLPEGTLMAQDEADRLLAPTPGGPVDGVRVRNLWGILSRRYRAKGYLDCKIDPHPALDTEAGVVNYTVDVTPGAVYHLGFVKFDNVGDQLRNLLIKNWQLLPGDPFDESYVSDFIMKAQKSDPVLMRTLAGVRSKLDVTADPQTHEVNVVLRLEKPQPVAGAGSVHSQ